MKAQKSETLTWTYAHDPALTSGTWTAILAAPVDVDGQTATRVSAWRDTNIGLWTIYLTDDADNQIGPAGYASDRAEAFAEGEFKVQYAIDQAAKFAAILGKLA